MNDDTYDISKGPVPTPKGGGKQTSARQQRVPVDLGRSRRVGLTALACVDCGAHKDDGRTEHARSCHAPPGAYVRVRTGPLKADQTSKDTGWVRA